MVRSRSQSLYSCALQSNLPLGTSGDPNGFEPECMIASSFERFVGQIGTFRRARRFPRILSLRWISEQGFSRIVGDTLTSEMSVIGPSEVTKGNKVFAETALDCNFDTNKSVARRGFIHGVSEATLPFKQVG